jgi:hypothetical protein
MLLELCWSYADAINGGTVPSIQNAWTYVCKNECQRAINQAVQTFESLMSEIL